MIIKPVHEIRINTHVSCLCLPPVVAQNLGEAPRDASGAVANAGGAKDCTPEIDTSEVTADFRWRFPNGPSVALSNGCLSLSGMLQRSVTFPVDVRRKLSMACSHGCSLS